MTKNKLLWTYLLHSIGLHNFLSTTKQLFPSTVFVKKKKKTYKAHLHGNESGDSHIVDDECHVDVTK